MIWLKRRSDSQPGRSRRGRRVLLAGTLLVLACIVLFGRTTVAWWGRRAAAEHLARGAVSAAEEWLLWTDRVQPDDWRTDLLRAACFRHLRQQQAWEGALQTAEGRGARGRALELEVRLGDAQFAADGIAAADFDALLEGGAPPGEAAAAVVFGLLAQGTPAAARKLVEDWPAGAEDAAQKLYLLGVCSWSAGAREAARTELEQALDRQPEHEMARSTLARVLEEGDQFAPAHAHYAGLARTAPRRESVRVDLARILRKLGRMQEARAVLNPPDAGDASPGVAIELAEWEYESGHSAEARRWFEQADLEAAHVADTLRAAATVLALSGDHAESRRLFARIDTAQSLFRQAGELERRLAIDPGDRSAADELQRLRAAAAATAARGSELPGGASSAPAPGQAGRGPAVVDRAAERVSPLYVQHCAECHGENGDGGGPAARHLWPRPRDLRSSRQRVVSTVNGVPALEDIERVIRLGLPGTAMPAFAELPPDQRQHLAEHVQQLRRAGIRAQLVEQAQQAGELPDEEELRQAMSDLTTAGAVLPVPPMGPATRESLTRGRELYDASGCRHCHGSDGTGTASLSLFDDTGRAAIPRDLVHDPFKGGSDPESISRRLVLGMPGTPHPAHPGLNAAELTALVHYCQSLAREPKRKLTNHERGLHAARAGW
jgi:tetratricopeptide (TPR) repeat protein